MPDNVDGTNLNAPVNIDWQSRTLQIPDDLGAFGVMSDEYARTIRFEANRFYKGIDMSKYSYRVNYTNPEGHGDIYAVDDLKADAFKISFSWKLSRFVTAIPGDIEFSICGLKFKSDKKTIENEVNTQTNIFTVYPGLEVTETPEITERLDWLASYLKNLEDKFKTINSVAIAYAASDSQSTTPSNWSTSIPSIGAGQWLWCRLTVTYNQGSNTVIYLKAYQGKDGKDGEVVEEERLSALEELASAINARLSTIETWRKTVDDEVTAERADRKKLWDAINTIAMNLDSYPFLIDTTYYTRGSTVASGVVTIPSSNWSGTTLEVGSM